jgi:peptidoglycan hydrolase-like protein with peptidoglycan-binding domain
VKRKEVLTENPLAIALMGALVGMGLEKEKAKKAAAQAVNDAQTGAWKDPDKQPAAARAPQGADYNQIMKRGSRGEGVKQLQINLGMTGPEVDGIFGPATEKAVKTFQKNSGAKVDGIVGPETRGMIEKYANNPDKDTSKVNVDRPTSKKYGAAPAQKPWRAIKLPGYGMQAGKIAITDGKRTYFVNPTAKNGKYTGGGPIQMDKNGNPTGMVGAAGFAVDANKVDMSAVKESVMTDKKQIDEASININGADAGEVAEILRMMQLAGADGAKVVGPDDINPGPKPCPICGKIHGPSQPMGGCGAKPKEPEMGDMIRMMAPGEAMEEETDDGDFQDASTEPDEEYANDVSASIPSGNDLHKEKGSYPATAGGDNPMNTEDEDLEEQIKSQLRAALEARK